MKVMTGDGRAVSDYGGLEAGGVERTDHPQTLYEKRVDALVMLLARSVGELNIDAHRRGMEQIPQIDYDTLPYYDKWLMTVHDNLVGAGLLDPAEIRSRVEALRRREDEGS